MRRPPRILAIDRPLVEFAPLFLALRDAGQRGGFLRLAAAPATVEPELDAAASLRGLLRAVAVGGGRTVAVKPLAGSPVLGDLLREHFRGCVVVLLEAADGADVPPSAGRLRADDDHWRLTEAETTERLTTAQLLVRLRRPSPPLRDGA